MIHHLGTSSSDPDDLTEMSSFLNKAEKLVSETLYFVVMSEITVFRHVPFEDFFSVLGRVAITAISLVASRVAYTNTRDSMTQKHLFL